MPSDLNASSPLPSVQPAVGLQGQTQQAQALNAAAVIQEATEDSFQQWQDEFAEGTMMATQRNSKTLEERVKRREKAEDLEQEEAEEDIQTEITQSADIAEQFEKKNPELKAKSLMTLQERITKDDTKEEILNKVLDSYPDPTIADEALDYLLQTSPEELHSKLKEAKELLNNRFGREIRAGKNILAESRIFSEKGLGSPDALRDMYRDVTGNPREAHALFNELVEKFPFESMKAVIAFLLHSLGKDLRSKGPSIPRGELFRLFTEARTLQAILGVYRFFIQRQKKLLLDLEKSGTAPSDKIEFEHLAKVFMKYLEDRYPAAQKVLLMAQDFDITSDLEAQEILLSCLYEALRHISPKLFRSPQHRQDIVATFLEALDEIEEQLERIEDEEEQKEREKKKS